MFLRYLFVKNDYFSLHSTLAGRVQILCRIFMKTWYYTLTGRQYSCTILLCTSVYKTHYWKSVPRDVQNAKLGVNATWEFNFFHISCFPVCFSTSRDRKKYKKERTACWGEGENRYKLNIAQISIWLISFDAVGLCVHKILILDKKLIELNLYWNPDQAHRFLFWLWIRPLVPSECVYIV
jgi:hypothetical protein